MIIDIKLSAILICSELSDRSLIGYKSSCQNRLITEDVPESVKMNRTSWLALKLKIKYHSLSYRSVADIQA